MKFKLFFCLCLAALITSFVTVEAQIPCGPTITPFPALSVNWPQYRYNMAHSGCNPYERILSKATVGGLVLDWQYETPHYIDVDSSPTVVNGVLYVDRFALDARTGALLWDSGLHTASSPAVVNGVVYTVSNTDNKVYALNAATGKPLWSYQASNNTFSSPALANGIVYIGASDGNVYSLNAATGDLLWKYTIGGANSFFFAGVRGRSVYIGSRDGNLYALDGSTGALRWKYTALGPVDASPAVANGIVYFGSFYPDNTLYALDASTGALIWKVTLAYGSFYSSPAVANGIVYFGGEGSYLYAFNASTGVVIWRSTNKSA